MKNYPNLTLAKEQAQIYSQVDGLSLQNLFYVYNNYFPNCLMFNRSSRDGKYYFDTNKMLQYFIENISEDEQMETIKYVSEDLSNGELSTGFCVLLHKSNLFARFENSISESYILFSNDNEEELKKFKEMAMKFYVAEENKKNNLYTIGSNANGFTLIENPVRDIKNFDIAKQYNDDFKPQNDKIEEFIKSDKQSGLVILHGLKGTGKTTYIRHLINTHPEKRFVFVPSGLIEILGSHSFQSFLLTLTNHIIILEDCENALRDRKTNMNGSAVSLLLNLSDGLLSDGLGLKFICTFNEDIKDMDEAITRKGRLAVKYEFKGLDTDKANNLLTEVFLSNTEDNLAIVQNGDEYLAYSLDNGVVTVESLTKEEVGDKPVVELPHTNKPMSLADIYNYDEESYVVERKKIM